MRRLSLPLVILISVVIAACLTGYALAETPDRKDEVVTESQALAPFKRIELSGSAVVVLVQDTNGPLVASMPANAAAKISVKVQKETLIIKVADGGRWWSDLFGRGPSGTPQITIHFKELDGIDVAGVVRLSARQIHVPDLAIEGSGGTTIQIDDLRATTLSVEGSGALKADLGGAGHRPEHRNFRCRQLPGRQARQRQRLGRGQRRREDRRQRAQEVHRQHFRRRRRRIHRRPGRARKHQRRRTHQAAGRRSGGAFPTSRKPTDGARFLRSFGRFAPAGNTEAGTAAQCVAGGSGRSSPLNSNGRPVPHRGRRARPARCARPRRQHSARKPVSIATTSATFSCG